MSGRAPPDELNAEGLFEAAGHLIPGGRGRPRKPRLRRAISTAYLATFTALTEQVAHHLPAGAANHSVRRLVSHTAARRVCTELSKSASVPWLPGHPACHHDLMMFAEHFEALYILRNLADYDHEYSCTKRDASAALQNARLAIDALASARRRCPDQLDIVSVAAIADDRRRRQISKPKTP